MLRPIPLVKNLKTIIETSVRLGLDDEYLSSKTACRWFAPADLPSGTKKNHMNTIQSQIALLGFDVVR